MNGISLVDVRAFFSWYFSQIPFVTAAPADIAEHFFGFNYDEKIGGEADTLTGVIAGLSNKTHTGLSGNIEYEVSAMSEPMWLDVSVVQKVDNGDFAQQEAAFDACKTTLFDFVSWAWQQASTGGDCEYPILRNFALDKISHQKITNSGGGFYGWSIRIYLYAFLNDTITFNPATAPPLWDLPENSIPIFVDGAWTYINSSVLASGNGVGKPIKFTAIAGQYTYTVADVPRLADAVGNIILRVMVDASYMMDANVSWDDTSFAISNITLDGTEKIIIEHQTPD